MRILLPISLALSLFAVCGTSHAADQADQHHPAQPAAAPQAPTAPAKAQHTPAAVESHPGSAKVDAQLGHMRELHDRWAKATPAEREGLMAEHMAAMREGLKMMHEMSAGPVPETGDHMSQEMKAKHDAMHQRMQMMEEMMQMMMDRLGDPPARH